MGKKVAALIVAVLVICISAGLFLHFFPGAVCQAVIELEKKRSGLESHRIQVDGIDYAYLAGGNGPPLVLLHGFGADGNAWITVARFLTKDFYVIAPDIPGFGDSTKRFELDYTVTSQIKRLNAFVRALGYSKIHIGGNSMGGSIAGAYAYRYPDEIETLWLIAPGGIRSSKDSYFQAELKKGNNFFVIRDRAGYDLMLENTFAEKPFILNFVSGHFAQKSIRQFRLYSKIFHEVLAETLPLEKALENMTIPTQVLWGTEDRILDKSGGDVLCRVMPESKCELIEGAGHVPMIEYPEETAELFLTFIRNQKK